MSKKTSKVYPNAGFTELINRIDSDTGLIFVDTPEETRVIREVFRNYQNSASVQFWSFGHGLHEIKNEDDPNLFYPHQYQRSRARTDKSGNAKSQLGIVQALTIIEEDCYDKIKPGEEVYKKTIYILRDADKFLQNSPPYIRAFRDIVYLASCTSSCIIITGFGLTVPDDLTKDSAYVKLPYPNMDEIRSVYIPMLKNKIEFHNKTATPENKISEKFDEEAIARACAGLTEDQILNVFQYSTSIDKAVSINRILEEKKSIINKSDILQYWICNDTLSDVGGFSSLKEWFGARKVIIDHPDEASKFSARYPSCIMLLGMQGSGKSFVAKAVAQDWGQGLIEFNTGKIFAGLVGESLAPDQEIILFDKDGIPERLTISEAYEKKPESYTLSYSADCFGELRKITNFIQHPRTKKLVEVTTNSGRSVKVTEDHSVFTIGKDGNLEEINPRNAKSGDFIAIPNGYEHENDDVIRRFSLIDIIFGKGEDDKWFIDEPLKVFDEADIRSVLPSKSFHCYKENETGLRLSDAQSILSKKRKDLWLRASSSDQTYSESLYLSDNILELFGWYTAEGSLSNQSSRLSIHQDEMLEVGELLTKNGIMFDMYHDSTSEKGTTIFFGGVGMGRILGYLELVDKKRIPAWIFGLSKVGKQSYLRGLFSGDGGISGDHIELSQKEKSLLRDVQDLLSSLGIMSSIYPRDDGGFRLIIHSSEYKARFMNSVGFTTKAKRLSGDSLVSNDKDKWGHRVPVYSDLLEISKEKRNETGISRYWISSESKYTSYKKYRDLIGYDHDIFWDEIKEIKDCDEQPEFVYDISVKHNQNFVSGGILCHNSEKRARQALAQAEAAGGILVMDEVDKALSGAGSSDRTDGGTTSRVIATMLDWLQKPHPGVFLIMTANDVTNLINNHPELVRKGRIDEVWFSDAPTAEERKEIFRIHLRKNKRDPEKFDIDRLAAYEFEDDADSKTYGPTGAEIEYAISDAIQEKFGLGGGKVIEIASEGDITTDDVIEKLKVIKPISYVAKDTIRKMRAWSAKNARSVTSLPEKKKTEKKTKSKLDIRSINPTL